MKYFHANSSYCNNTIDPFVFNLTSSYTDQRDEASMVATSVAMFLLVMFNLLSRFSDVSAILNPSIRLFLSTSLSLFLPVMSYLFSEAKNEDKASYSGSTTSSGKLSELSLRARTILAWMLLVELLRKKVEAVLVTAGMEGYSGTIDRATRIAWLGYLVFFNIKSAGRKATYGILWVIAFAKLVQRVIITELGKRSFAYGKKAQLLNSYMAQILHQEQEQQEDGSELLKSCKYAVMEEENLEGKAGPEGYELKNSTDVGSTIVTVGRIWRLADAEKDGLLHRDPRLKRLCLSFALYKLLRRRFEDLPITCAEARNCRDLIFKGLCKEEADREAVAVALFQVFNDELHFLCEHYHSVLPVVLASPLFLVANYFLFPIVVSAFCLLTIILCSHGDVFYAFRSIKSDNYAISVGVLGIAGCLLSKILKSPPVLFSTIDMSITILLILTCVFEEIWEFIVFLLSNWLMVSLLCNYTSKPHWSKSPIFRGAISRIQWVRRMVSRPNLNCKQLSVLWFCRLSLTLRPKAVPEEVGKSITGYLLKHVEDRHARPLSNGWSTLHANEHGDHHHHLSWACRSRSVAEVILTWHIATSLLEVRYPRQRRTALGPERKVARMLSRYLVYLVAFCPELLPDDKEGTERVYKDMNKELEEELLRWRYYLSPQRVRYTKLMQIAGRQVVPELETTTAVQKGARLGKILIDEAAKNDKARTDVWILLANVWTELMVYVAPSSGEVHVKAHKEALARGGEFVTVLWALATHTGITRPDIKPWEAARPGETQFGHAVGGGVIAQFGHVTGHGVTKGIRIGNKVKKMLSLK